MKKVKKSKKKYNENGENYCKLYNEKGEVIGKIHPLYENTQTNYLRGVSLFLLTEDGNLVLERRSKSVKLTTGKVDLISGHCDGSEKGKNATYRELKEEVGIKKKKVYKIKKVEAKVPLQFDSRKFFISFYAAMLKDKKILNQLNLQSSEVEDVLIIPMQEGFDLIRKNLTRFPYVGNEEKFEQIFKSVELFYQKSLKKREEELCEEK